MSTVIQKDEALANVATNLKNLVDARGIGVRQLARDSENEPMTVSRLIRGTNMPSADCIYRICVVLGVTIDSLFEKPKKKRKKTA